MCYSSTRFYSGLYLNLIPSVASHKLPTGIVKHYLNLPAELYFDSIPSRKERFLQKEYYFLYYEICLKVKSLYPIWHKPPNTIPLHKLPSRSKFILPTQLNFNKAPNMYVLPKVLFEIPKVNYNEIFIFPS